VLTLPKKVLHHFSCLMKQFPFTLGESSYGSRDLVSPSNGEIFLEELLLHLSPRSDHVGFQGIKLIFGFILSEMGKRRGLKAYSKKFCILMVEQISRNSSRCL